MGLSWGGTRQEGEDVIIVVIRGRANRKARLGVSMKRRGSSPWRPTPAQLAAARGRTVRDVIAPNLRVLFCGINPGLYSGAVGHHFARPGNRFWPVLHAAGFTPRLVSPFEEDLLPQFGCGITNLVARTTAAAAELTPDELRAGAARLRRKLRRYRPRVIAFLGVGSYCSAFECKQVTVGPQPEALEGTAVWVLPNPSGLNANYQLPELTRLFRRLREAVEAE
jgi:double-stranded uracil-DNA glycosylase